MYNALKVITQTDAIRDFLLHNDPRALAQADKALAEVEQAQRNLALFIDTWSHATCDKPESRIGYAQKLTALLAAAGLEPEVMVAVRNLRGVEYRMFRRGRDYRMTGGKTEHTLSDASEQRARAHWNGYSLGN